MIIKKKKKLKVIYEVDLKGYQSENIDEVGAGRYKATTLFGNGYSRA